MLFRSDLGVGVEEGYNVYLHNVGVSEVKYFGDGFGSIEVYKVGNPVLTGEPRWLKLPVDNTIHRRNRIRVCSWSSCAVLK